MGIIHTPDSLTKWLENQIRDVLENEASEKMVDIIKEHIDKDVYAKYEPEEYIRTHTLKNSLQRTINSNNDGVIITLDHDDSLMDYQSKVSGQSVDEQQKIPNAIEYGKIHPLFGEGFPYLRPRPYMENSKEEILRNLDKIISKAIAKHVE